MRFTHAKHVISTSLTKKFHFLLPCNHLPLIGQWIHRGVVRIAVRGTQDWVCLQPLWSSTCGGQKYFRSSNITQLMVKLYYLSKTCLITSLT